MGQAVSEKIKFYIYNVNDLWPRSRNDLDLEYSQNFINLKENAIFNNKIFESKDLIKINIHNIIYNIIYIQ